MKRRSSINREGESKLTWLNGTCNLITGRSDRLRGLAESGLLGVWGDGIRDLVTNALTSALVRKSAEAMI